MKKLIHIVLAILFMQSCEDGTFDYSSDQGSETGTAGSLARFAIAKDHLYTVDNNYLSVYDITDVNAPDFIEKEYVGFEIETIFPKGNLLFLGSRWGVYIYSIDNPRNPLQLSLYEHTYSCDPVVVQGNYAYSTLNSSGPCSRGTDQLDIIDVSNPEYPKEVNSITMSNPKGLGVKGDLLFVCDDGIEIYNISNPEVPIFQKSISIPAYDVIPIDTLLLVATDEGLYEYEITDNNELQYLSALYTKNQN
jgi:hypothetical protein